jgi:exonuclease VII large subunit
MRFPFRKRIRLVVLVVVVLGFGVFAPVGAADQPANPECWGVVTSQRASTEHDIGTHASSQSEPRLGLGNVANLLTGSYQPGELGSLLASLDDLDATHCP